MFWIYVYLIMGIVFIVFVIVGPIIAAIIITSSIRRKMKGKAKSWNCYLVFLVVSIVRFPPIFYLNKVMK